MKKIDISYREKKLSNQETIEQVIDLMKWEKYHNPRDENERWFNRWIDRAIDAIELYVDTFEPEKKVEKRLAIHTKKNKK